MDQTAVLNTQSILPPTKPASMKYGKLAGLDKQLSRVVYGTLFLDKVEEPFELLDSVLAGGCNTFDCASIYGGGACEKVMGEWIRARSVDPASIVVVTKGGCHGQDKLWAAKLSKSEIEQDVAASLTRLQLPCVDIYLLHRDDPSMPIADVVDTMDSLVKRGLIKIWGVSNWSAERLEAALEYAHRCSKTPPAVDSLQFSLAEPSRPVWPGTTYLQNPSERLRWYARNNVVVFAWECLAKGFMAGKWSREDALQEVSGSTEHLHTNPGLWRDSQLRTAYLTKDNFDRRDRAMAMAEEKGVSITQIALAYVMNQPGETFALVGTTKMHHAKDAIDAAAISLSAQQVLMLSGDASAMSRCNTHEAALDHMVTE